MAISFQCSHCNSTLNVPDEHAGKQAKCPQCSTVSVIPTAVAAKPNTPPQQSPAAQQNPFSDFGGPSAATSKTGANPYVAPMAAADYSGAHPDEFRPLVDAMFLMRAVSWWLIGVGVLYCISIVGIIFGWIPIWMGIALKRSCDSLDRGYTTNDRVLLTDSMNSMSTFFRIAGVVVLVSLALFALYMAFVFMAVIIAMVGAANA